MDRYSCVLHILPVLHCAQIALAFTTGHDSEKQTQVEPTLPKYVSSADLVRTYEGERQNNYNEYEKAVESTVEAATFRIIPLESETILTFGEVFPTRADFPKHIVEKSISADNSYINSEKEPTYISNYRSEIIDNFPYNSNFRSLPDIYDHSEVFPYEFQEKANSYEIIKSSANLPERQNEQTNKYKYKIIDTGENVLSESTNPQYNILVIPEVESRYVAQDLPSSEESYHIEPVKQLFVPTVSPKVIPKNLKEIINFSQPSTDSPIESIHLPNISYETQDHEFRPTEYTSDNSFEAKSSKSKAANIPTYSYAYSVNGGSYGPTFAKHENSDGHLTKGEYSVALPDGRLQTVTYTVLGDKGGFSANVHYSGKARHPPQSSKQSQSPGKSFPSIYRGRVQGKGTSFNPHSVKYVPHKSFQE